MPYRQLERFTRALHRLIPRLPPIDYSWVRRRILRLDLRPYMSLRSYRGPVSIAVDYREVKSMDVTTDDIHDSEVLPSLYLRHETV
jgi:hypothetical protein